MDTAEDSLSQNSDEQLVSLQIYVPELVVQKCMQFNRDELIWDVKNQILAALPKELKEGFNYGLFCPPVNGRAGKFLDEERPLADYPFTDNSAYVEAHQTLFGANQSTTFSVHHRRLSLLACPTAHLHVYDPLSVPYAHHRIYVITLSVPCNVDICGHSLCPQPITDM
ncbi:Protein shank [Araneus ventricosus]|uniref:Protein shank n=1 Tax=Araneus ventricosus TaxID=182803 RepID=A0A4Y2SW85_ARAVE|nr:Protein shank [Araneus ventricosus]